MISGNGFAYHENGSVGYFTIPLFEQTGLVKACFTSRLGGISVGARASLNLGFNRGDPDEIVMENYQRLCNSIKLDPTQLVFGRQVHGDVIKRVYASDKGKGIFRENDMGDADGLITDIPGVALATLYADCVPLFFLDPAHKVIGLSHAGWRGTVAGIGPKTLKAMYETFGTQPEQCLAAIGPSIGQCCFEVDEPVACRFVPLLRSDVSDVIRKSGNKYKVDLWKTNAALLVQAGMAPENIAMAELCTSCHPHWFFSHRRDKGDTGRMAAIIMLCTGEETS